MTAERTLDVRGIDGPPFEDIMSALDSLEDDEQLRLIAGFEPIPLYTVLETRGLTHDSERHGDEEWHVLIQSP